MSSIFTFPIFSRVFLFSSVLYALPLLCLALHDFVTNIYPQKLFVKMLVRPLLLTLNACTKFTVDEDEVEHFEPSRRAIPVIVAVLSWFHAMSEEAGLAEPSDFYSCGVSNYNVETLFEDLYKMKKASQHEKSRNFFLCAHPFLLVSIAIGFLLPMNMELKCAYFYHHHIFSLSFTHLLINLKPTVSEL